MRTKPEQIWIPTKRRWEKMFMKDAILRDKVLDYLVDNCVQVEQSDKK